MTHAVCVAGARPNLIKIKPVIVALEATGARTTFVHTGQHYDEVMSGVFLDELGLRPPDRFLGVGSGTHAQQTGRVMIAFEEVLEDASADVVVVVGDINSTLGCALVAAKSGVRVAHVEAGLRSRDWSMPEEVNRVATDRVSDFLFAPSDDGVANLLREGYRADQIHLVGNVMVDSLLANIDRARKRETCRQFDLDAGGFGLVTLHRPANVDDPDVLGSLIDILAELARRLPLVFPVHPRTRSRLGSKFVPPGITLIDPCGYLDFLSLQADAALVLTDSGGVQEETTVLGVPCLTLRDNTERPVTVSEGTNQVVGRSRQRVLAAATEILDHGWPVRSPALWDGRAGERIANLLVNELPGHSLRPTDLAD
jgi:UDP-N-acetylglucosamine 2-epimerase (non-hydrolysing)